MNEQEEFEFRLRLEREQGGGSPAAPQSAKPKGPAGMQTIANIGGGLLRGAGSIGATLLTPYDLLAGNTKSIGNPERRAAMDGGLQALGVDTDSMAYGGGKLAGELAGTMGVGGGIANLAGRGIAKVAPAVLPKVAPALDAVRTAGMSAGGVGGAGGLALRTVGGGGTSFAAAGAVNPEDAKQGGIIGAALPSALKVAGKAGNAAGAGIRATGKAIVGSVSPEVAALAKRAEELGIKVPVDRITNSKPMNAAAASLNYMPFSGRAGTEDAMFKSMNKALSRTFGQDSDNVTMALRKAQTALGSQFDTVLQGNTVKMTPSFKAALADAETQANSELGNEAASVIRKQIALIQTKGAAGEIDGQAAYNIKKALDRIGGGNSDAAFYARDLKKKLMEALNESLGPQEAAAFAKVRQQYGNMLALENLATNGAEGGISAGRLANMKNINNPDLQELADIAAQFLKSRESPHGALQRLVIGGTATGAAGGLGALPMLPVAAGLGRATNALLNSNAARNTALGVSGQPNALQRLLENPDFVQMGYRGAPVASGGR